MTDHDPGLAILSAVEAAALIARGSISSEALVQACLEQVQASEETVQAWTYLDPEHALAQARAADLAHQAGRHLGPLHGLPVGIKDIVDTADMPTENGTVLDEGRRPRDDAAAVARLREAGAVIMGKTVSTELAYFTPGKTRNPRNPEHTPGGSSSGSAAAVAAGMVPFAVGSQTNGSVVRPAAFCGVVGYKPTHGLISRHGVAEQSRSLDTLGVFARSVLDAALIAEVLIGHDAKDPDTRPNGRYALSETAAKAPPLRPFLAMVKGPVWDKAEPDTREAFAELAEVLGDACEDVELPELFNRGHAAHRVINVTEMALNYGRYYQRGKDKLSAALIQAIEEGQRALALDYAQALVWREALNGGVEAIFERYDAILTPSAAGPAPKGLHATGDPAFCTLWSLCGTPAISLPLLNASNGLPMGVQLVGRRGDDARLLRTARWLTETLGAEAPE